jgi:serine/threonine-protein kinase
VVLQPGAVVDGRYRIVRKLADGGMATVFRAEHILIKRQVALKLLRTDLAADREMVQRFIGEAEMSATLGHPHIVESTDMGFTSEGIPYIVFEYLEGYLLTEEILRLGRLPVPRALMIARQLASALAAVHGAGIAHLDLKSDNVFLTNCGAAFDHAMLLDFGIARLIAARAGTTQQDVVMGTPEYMAPEQVTDPDAVDQRADIYALGVVLYEMLTGRCPFMGEEPHWVLARIVHDTPPPLVRPVTPALRCLLFDGLLAKRADERLQTMAEVVTMLDMLIATSRSMPSDAEPFDDDDAEPQEPRTTAPVRSRPTKRSIQPPR